MLLLRVDAVCTIQSLGLLGDGSKIFPSIKASFPGNLHLVLVLRPTSFFHRTVTDIGFRFSQEDFMLKMPVRQLLLSYQTCDTSPEGTPCCCHLNESNVLWWPRTSLKLL